MAFWRTKDAKQAACKEQVWQGWVSNTTSYTATSSTTCGSTNELTWQHWVTGSTTSNSCTIGTSNTVWRLWVDTAPGNNTPVRTMVNGQVWESWQTAAQIIRPTHVAPRIESMEDIARREREAAEYKARIAAADEERKMAKARARKLLVENLTPQQRDSYESHGYFDVTLLGRTFRIHQGTHGNVKLLTPQGATEESYCVQPSGVPEEDAMLSQKLALELAPGEFFKQANVTTYLPNGARGYRARGLPPFMAQA